MNQDFEVFLHEGKYDSSHNSCALNYDIYSFIRIFQSYFLFIRELCSMRVTEFQNCLSFMSKKLYFVTCFKKFYLPRDLSFMLYQSKLTLTVPIVFVTIQSFSYRNLPVAPDREFATVLFVMTLANPN